MSTQTTDVLVIGAGVAGCAAALLLSERHAVTLVDRSLDRGERIGESLPGAATPLLQRLGVQRRFESDRHRPSLGSASVWGSNILVRRDGFNDPAGAGWCLDRARFDAMLLEVARERGVRVMAPVDLVEVARITASTAGWRARLQCDREAIAVDAKLVVLAHGRSVPPALDPSLRVQATDRLVCRFVRLPPLQTPPRVSGFVEVEAIAQGWWYRTTLPDGHRIVAFHTDADLPVARQACHRQGFAALLRETISLNTPDLPPDATIGRTSARSQSLSHSHGRDWCAVGDASLAFDPLSSQGLFHALYSAVRGAEACLQSMAGDPAAMPAYGNQIARIAGAYATNLRQYYALETRFADSPFWLRRHVRPDPAVAGGPHTPVGATDSDMRSARFDGAPLAVTVSDEQSLYEIPRCKPTAPEGGRRSTDGTGTSRVSQTLSQATAVDGDGWPCAGGRCPQDRSDPVYSGSGEQRSSRG